MEGGRKKERFEEEEKEKEIENNRKKGLNKEMK